MKGLLSDACYACQAQSRTIKHVGDNRESCLPSGRERNEEKRWWPMNFGPTNRDSSVSPYSKLSSTKKECRENTVAQECDSTSYFRNTPKRFYPVGESIKYQCQRRSWQNHHQETISQGRTKRRQHNVKDSYLWVRASARSSSGTKASYLKARFRRKT